MDYDRVIRTVLKIRAAKSQLTREYEAAKAKLDEQQETLENVLLGSLDRAKVKNMRTDAGTVYTTETVKVSCEDWPAYHAWLMQQGDLGGLQKRVGEKFITDYMAAHKGEELPPGIRVARQRVARVRVGDDD